MSWPTHIVAAAGYVFDERDNILLVKTHNRGWDATGGQVEIGENIEEGVLREILEESGVSARVNNLVGIYSNVGQHKYYDNVTDVPTKVMFDFICEYVSGTPTTSDETSDVIWVHKTQIIKYVTQPVLRYRFEKVLSYSGRITYGSYITKPEFKLLTERFV